MRAHVRAFTPDLVRDPLAREWAYARSWSSNAERAAPLPAWLDHYNYDRPHTALGNQRPAAFEAAFDLANAQPIAA